MADDKHDPHFPSIEPLGDPPAKKVAAPPISAVSPDAKPYTPPDLQRTDVPCRNCGFNLRGLSPDGNCPECGSPIWRSICEDRLMYCGESYLQMLYRGLICILIAALATVGVTVLSFIVVGIAIAVGISASGSAFAQSFTAQQGLISVVTQTVMLPISLLMLYGWWLFSAPDPGVSASDSGQKPRRIVRGSTVAMAAATTLTLICQTAALMVSWMELVAGGVSIVNAVAGIVQFFASMLYVRWLAPRIPSMTIENRAKLYMWLLPVIYVVGVCVVVGPIVATVMYFLLLNLVRIELKKIIAAQESGVGRELGPVPSI